jgi:hypothetical protein
MYTGIYVPNGTDLKLTPEKAKRLRGQADHTKCVLKVRICATNPHNICNVLSTMPRGQKALEERLQQ